MKWGEFSVTAFAAALLVLMISIVLQVLFSALDINPIFSLQADWLLIGDAITLNSLLDFQWHLLVITGLLPAGIVWLRDKHVRVDFLYQNRSDRFQSRIDVIGNVIFAAPFLALAIPASMDFLHRAWSADEGARNGGLNDLWVIKAMLPLGLTILGLAILFESIRLIRVGK